MIKIVKTDSNQWGISAPKFGVIMEPGMFGDMIDQAAALGLSPMELEAAFTDMLMKGTNCAEFGLYGTFMYSTKAVVITRNNRHTPEAHEAFMDSESAVALIVGVA